MCVQNKKWSKCVQLKWVKCVKLAQMAMEINVCKSSANGNSNKMCVKVAQMALIICKKVAQMALI